MPRAKKPKKMPPGCINCGGALWVPNLEGGVQRCPVLGCARGEYLRARDGGRGLGAVKPLTAGVAPMRGQSAGEWE